MIIIRNENKVFISISFPGLSIKTKTNKQTEVDRRLLKRRLGKKVTHNHRDSIRPSSWDKGTVRRERTSVDTVKVTTVYVYVIHGRTRDEGDRNLWTSYRVPANSNCTESEWKEECEVESRSVRTMFNPYCYCRNPSYKKVNGRRPSSIPCLVKKRKFNRSKLSVHLKPPVVRNILRSLCSNTLFL